MGNEIFFPTQTLAAPAVILVDTYTHISKSIDYLPSKFPII